MSERIFNVSRSTKTGKTVNVGDFPTVEQAQAAMLSHYKVTPKRGDFRYRIFEEELEEINGVTLTIRNVSSASVTSWKTTSIMMSARPTTSARRSRTNCWTSIVACCSMKLSSKADTILVSNSMWKSITI